MRKKMLALALAMSLTFSLGLTGCGGSDSGNSSGSNNNNATEQSGSSTSGGKQLAVQVGPDPETVDPALNSTSDGSTMIIHAFEGLLSTNEKGEIVAGQAEKWESSEDGLTWTFHLRDGLKWSDGSDLTANDFVYSWKRICDPNTAAPYAETVLSMVKGYKEAIEGNLDALGVTAPDDKTLVVELETPCSFFESLAAFPTMYPVQEATVSANPEAWATAPETYISNGPFKMTEWVPGSHIIFSKNENYWNADAVKLDSLKFALMEDSNAAYSAYKNNELLLIKDVPTEEVPSLQGQADFHVEPIIGTYYLSLNLQKEPFTNEKVRQALNLAIDRDYVANTLMQGTYSPAYNVLGPGWLDTDGTTEFQANANGGKSYISEDYEANLAEAKKLLEEAGYPNGEGLPVLTYSTNDSGYHKTVAEYLQQAWKELGITVNVDIVEWSSFTPQRRSGDYEMARNGWVGDYTDPSNMLDLFYSSNGNNDGKFNNKDYDAQMDIARSTTDAKERSEALHKAEDILMEQAGCIPVAYYNDFWLQSEKITGSWHSSTGHWHLMYADITE